MNHFPTISIIIPVYRVEKYLRLCLDSVLAQSYTDWECICVDDGSPDNSGIIIDEYASIDSRIRVIHQMNKGVSTARNVGISMAKGDWICFIDSDDWVAPDYLRNLANAIEEDIDYIVSGNKIVIENTEIDSILPNRTCTFALNDSGIEPFADLLEKHLLNGPVCKLFRRRLINNNSIQFPTDINCGEDLLFNYAYLQYTDRIATISVADYSYRQLFVTSLSHKPRPNRFNDEYKQWCVRRNFMKFKGLWNEQIRKEMYRVLWGIIYDGLFEKSASRTYSYIRRILSIPEINDLKSYSSTFYSANWIKYAITHRFIGLFWLITRIK